MKKTLIVGIIVLALLGLGLSFLFQGSNCGGNSAALVYTDSVARYVMMAKMDGKVDSPKPFSSIVPPSSWPKIFSFGWGVKSYWVRKIVDPSESEPIVICGQYFGNVPQPRIWNFYRQNPKFAAGFLNGGARLLEVSEYNALDFNEYQYITRKNFSNK